MVAPIPVDTSSENEVEVNFTEDVAHAEKRITVIINLTTWTAYGKALSVFGTCLIFNCIYCNSAFSIASTSSSWKLGLISD